MIYREAIGNDLAVRATLGKVIRARPTTIQAFRDRAEFSITGGLGYAPITITGLSNYRIPVLEVKEGDKWIDRRPVRLRQRLLADRLRSRNPHVGDYLQRPDGHSRRPANHAIVQIPAR